MNRRLVLAGALGLLAGGGALTAYGASRTSAAFQNPGASAPVTAPEEKPSPTPPAFSLARVDATKLVSVTTEAWFSWALMDRRDGALIGSANFAQTNRTCSMIKSWIATDYLRQKPSPSSARLADIEIMIRDSDSVSADRLMNEIGRVPSFTRMRDLCKTTDFTPKNTWSQAVVSARDMCRVGDTIAKGAIANPKWTEHVLGLMRTVRRGGWGVREAFPAAEHPNIAIKNGWDTTSAQGTYHANCLAIHQRWVMVVLTRYPLKISANENYGADVGKSVATQLLQNSELRPLFS
ncbi:MAG TPA: serine hydrolase [Candidatus Limnocylindrales bacterium]|nr:serine hydrolase [Candidatus Limnocylindrales bacterium]